MFLDTLKIIFKTCHTLTQLSLCLYLTIILLGIEHDCLEIISHLYSSKPDLKVPPLENVGDSWLKSTGVDGSSFINREKEKLDML